MKFFCLAEMCEILNQPSRHLSLRFMQRVSILTTYQFFGRVEEYLLNSIFQLLTLVIIRNKEYLIPKRNLDLGISNLDQGTPFAIKKHTIHKKGIQIQVYHSQDKVHLSPQRNFQILVHCCCTKFRSKYTPFELFRSQYTFQILVHCWHSLAFRSK